MLRMFAIRFVEQRDISNTFLIHRRTRYFFDTHVRRLILLAMHIFKR